MNKHILGLMHHPTFEMYYKQKTVAAFEIFITTQVLRADFLIFPVSDAPSNIGSTKAASSLLKNLSKSISSMCLHK
jgi:hypothetical protein